MNEDQNPTEYLTSAGFSDDFNDMEKKSTPYGYSLSWDLGLSASGDKGHSKKGEGMQFTIHLKDNDKVRN